MSLMHDSTSPKLCCRKFGRKCWPKSWSPWARLPYPERFGSTMWSFSEVAGRHFSAPPSEEARIVLRALRGQGLLFPRAPPRPMEVYSRSQSQPRSVA